MNSIIQWELCDDQKKLSYSEKQELTEITLLLGIWVGGRWHRVWLGEAVFYEGSDVLRFSPCKYPFSMLVPTHYAHAGDLPDPPTQGGVDAEG